MFIDFDSWGHCCLDSCPSRINQKCTKTDYQCILILIRGTPTDKKISTNTTLCGGGTSDDFTITLN